MLLAIVMLIAFGTAVLARFGARWWFERSNASRYTRGEQGVIRGAEPITLDAGGDSGLLLLHGFGDTPQTLRDLAHALHARGYSVSVPLLPGHGRSLAGFVATNATQWLAEANAALERLQGAHARVGIVGLSMGGALGSILAADHRDVRTLVLIAPYVRVSKIVRWLARRRGIVNHVLPYFPALGARSIHDQRARAENLAYGALNASVLAELVHVVDRADAALPSLTLPVLMIQSREDNRTPVRSAERAFERIGSADKHIVWLTGCGHILTVDYQRERVTDETIAWLDRVMAPDQAVVRA